MQLLAFLLNLPWTIALVIAGLLSLPTKAELHTKPFAMIIHVRSFWYYKWVSGQRSVRAMALGSVILLGPELIKNDLEHELVHIQQHQREPFIHPILNFIETMNTCGLAS